MDVVTHIRQKRCNRRTGGHGGEHKVSVSSEAVAAGFEMSFPALARTSPGYVLVGQPDQAMAVDRQGRILGASDRAQVGRRPCHPAVGGAPDV